MSSPNCDIDATLPHAGLLSYFRLHHGVDNCDRSAQTICTESSFLSDMKHRVFDEEAQRNSWDADSTTDTECEDLLQPAHRHYQGVFHSVHDLWGFVCVVTLVSCAIYLGLDLALNQYGLGMGLIDRIRGGRLPPSPIARELHFCLSSPNREAPGPQTWHLMSSRQHRECTTEVVTLLATPTEVWKLRSDDDIVFGNGQRLRQDSIRVGKFLGIEDVLSRMDLGDNIAEEGVLSQSGEVTIPRAVVIT
ncbi:uncharacterized protein EKO05_0001151 [Ascochyta rabiei]|uniref:Uncharacterized protein n=1 Tax=Didymella rabiei TaxID=5454 RepID=A0A163LUI9_DIDRA|nr:uncharacterized protein EKO05_0001151 [Ascochyta rabiei]KZM28133.1 hypothetical protein ST47_g720 [Ascochyta rabiei]UPX10493.1 hypothetical protein EKO05_0001151 [Ascochyta rabiei]